MSERFKIKIPEKKEPLNKEIYYIVDLNDIISEKIYDLIFNDPIGLKIERIIDLIETDKPDVTKYHHISKDINVIILVPNDIFYSEFKMFKLRLILNELPIKYNSILNQYQIEDLKISTIHEFFKVIYDSDNKNNASYLKISKL